MKPLRLNQGAWAACLGIVIVAIVGIGVGRFVLSESDSDRSPPPADLTAEQAQPQPDAPQDQRGSTASHTDSATPAGATRPDTDPAGPPSHADAPVGCADTSSVDSDEVVSLWRCGDAASAQRLGHIVRTDPDKDVRLKAVVALGQMRQSETIVQLFEALTASDDRDVQLRARTVLLRRLGLRFGNPPDPDDEQGWARMVETIRSLPGVKSAYAARTGENEEGQ